MINLKPYEGQFITIDRITEGIAVVELPDDNMANIPANELPQGVKEGYVMKVTDGQLVIDIQEYERRKKEMEEMLKGFFD